MASRFGYVPFSQAALLGGAGGGGGTAVDNITGENINPRDVNASGNIFAGGAFVDTLETYILEVPTILRADSSGIGFFDESTGVPRQDVTDGSLGSLLSALKLYGLINIVP